jgi:hypothetical protein
VGPYTGPFDDTCKQVRFSHRLVKIAGIVKNASITDRYKFDEPNKTAADR